MSISRNIHREPPGVHKITILFGIANDEIGSPLANPQPFRQVVDSDVITGKLMDPSKALSVKHLRQVAKTISSALWVAITIGKPLGYPRETGNGSRDSRWLYLRHLRQRITWHTGRDRICVERLGNCIRKLHRRRLRHGHSSLMPSMYSRCSILIDFDFVWLDVNRIFAWILILRQISRGCIHRIIRTYQHRRPKIDVVVRNRITLAVRASLVAKNRLVGEGVERTNPFLDQLFTPHIPAITDSLRCSSDWRHILRFRA
jgi:hypothetical protein